MSDLGRRIRRRAVALLLTASCVVGVTTALSAPAQAANGCSGSRIEHIPMRDDTYDDLMAYLDVYYDSSTGNNCAATVATGPNSEGILKGMYVVLVKCSQTTPNKTSCTNIGSKRDPASPGTYGRYYYYAGPVTVYSPNNCIFAEGAIESYYPDSTGTTHSYGSTRGSTGYQASHC
ncbi:hypothetical protein Psi02_68730 [Planotetraspora silvatica]|uniref:Spore-associated protein A n=1 Tax=Planotetraspora silvatica TaxID=234614 RepID=A0A8J3XRL3_9ACTN|nr:hypothetical protein [Planotetraspora silvatica]GII50449.1 hypothetical protein Psi02_68730 [Planotetraspora silvatica]